MSTTPRTLRPYGGTSGWSGSSASRARALEDDRTGRTKDRHERLMRVMERRVAWDGITWFELSDYTGWHHGEASGALTRAHRIGAVERLVEQRGVGKGSHIYVLPQYLDGRAHTPYRSRSAAKLARDTLEFLEVGDVQGAMDFLHAFLDAPRIVPAVVTRRRRRRTGQRYIP